MGLDDRLVWRRVHVALLLILGSASTPATGQSRLDDAAADAVYDCPNQHPSNSKLA